MIADRVELPVGLDIIPEIEVKQVYDKFVASIPVVPQLKEEDIPNILKVEAEDMPVCGLLAENGDPLHPPHLNNKKGKVSVSRKMGGQPGAPLGLKQIIEIFGEEVTTRQNVYTGGTWKGLMTRVQKQMGRKTKSVFNMFKTELGYTPSKQQLFKILDSLFPREKSDWPILEGDLEEHLNKLKVTASSSAGAPYWRNKGEVMEEIIDVTLPVVVDAIKTKDGLRNLYQRQPELFLVEVKNKLDRYKIGELEQKTRPYCCVPAHWAFLFSILTQKFQESLQTFDKVESSVNAYGFSAAYGGLTRMYEWMMRTKRARYVVYGDDTCLVVNQGGKIYRVDPDFSQMDGSVDREDVKLTAEWVLASNLKDDGLDKSPFWDTVVREWVDMATDPQMIIEGEKIYTKKNPHGLMSGVPGTTLFDTVKSALAWYVYLQVCARDKQSPLDGDFASDFMRRNGLEIKAGTWNPAPIPTKLSTGLLLTDHKFLGVQMMVTEYKGEFVVVPTIPESEALEMLVVQKDNPYERVSSELTMQRRLYDRARGLFMTFGFTLPNIVDALHNIVNKLPGLPIIMLTNLGTGEKPEHIILEDFAYPDSSGFPTEQYCKALYAGDPEMPGWLHIFPSLEPTLQMLRSEDRTVKRITLTTRMEDATVFVPTAVPYTEDKDIPETFEVLETQHPQSPPKNLVPHKRSEIINVVTKEKPKVQPTLGECLHNHLLEQGPMKILDLTTKYRVTLPQFFEVAKQYGIVYTAAGFTGIAYVSDIQSPYKGKQEKTIQFAEENKTLINKGTSFRDALLNSVKEKEVVLTAPENIVIDRDALSLYRITNPPPMPKDEIKLLQWFNEWSNLLDGVHHVNWETTAFHLGQPNPVEVELIATVPQKNGDAKVPIASCRAISKKIASQYIARAIYEQSGHGVALTKHNPIMVEGPTIEEEKAKPKVPVEPLKKWGNAPDVQQQKGEVLKKEHAAQIPAITVQLSEKEKKHTLTALEGYFQRMYQNILHYRELPQPLEKEELRAAIHAGVVSAMRLRLSGDDLKSSMALSRGLFKALVMRRNVKETIEAWGGVEEIAESRARRLYKDRHRDDWALPDNAPKAPPKVLQTILEENIPIIEDLNAKPCSYRAYCEIPPNKAVELNNSFLKSRSEELKVLKAPPPEPSNLMDFEDNIVLPPPDLYETPGPSRERTVPRSPSPREQPKKRAKPEGELQRKVDSRENNFIYAGQEDQIDLVPGKNNVFLANKDDNSELYQMKRDDEIAVFRSVNYMSAVSWRTQSKNRRTYERRRSTPERRTKDNRQRYDRRKKAKSPNFY